MSMAGRILTSILVLAVLVLCGKNPNTPEDEHDPSPTDSSDVDTTTSDSFIRVPQDFSTIQAAIDASKDGDSILVAAGTFKENISFNGKSISLIGHIEFERLGRCRDPSENENHTCNND